MSRKAAHSAASSRAEAGLVLASDDGSAFGPSFFLRQLAGFVRARCPDPAEHMPIVEIALHDGSQLHLCHVIGLAPRWVALAAYEPSVTSRGHAMCTEFVPYGSIVRVTIRVARAEETRLGFSQPEPPTLMHALGDWTPEAMLRVAGTAVAVPQDALPPAEARSEGARDPAPAKRSARASGKMRTG